MVGRFRGFKKGEAGGQLRVTMLFDYLVGNGHRVGWLGWSIEEGNSNWINEDHRRDMKRQAEIFQSMKNGEY
jgi:hypothetical protein